MPLYDYVCPACGHVFEELVSVRGGEAASPPCPSCGQAATERQPAAVSSLTGRERTALPGFTDHGCCGSRPAERSCRPGTCCGKA
ncbi:MAG: zinc ribbon domain-containing protein [Desulfovibrionaceae bacterium]|nr:zinc ribbon domain-containing protein [Desulfovibrionaceae bacterium]